jgi:hypothetical protein
MPMKTFEEEAAEALKRIARGEDLLANEREMVLPKLRTLLHSTALKPFFMVDFRDAAYDDVVRAVRTSTEIKVAREQQKVIHED